MLVEVLAKHLCAGHFAIKTKAVAVAFQKTNQERLRNVETARPHLRWRAIFCVMGLDV